MTEFGWLTRSVERTLLWAKPDGGQGRARRNAWSAMVEASQRRADRLSADGAIRAAAARPRAAGGPVLTAAGGSS